MSWATERAKRVAKIRQNPGLYKVCEGCESIVTIKNNLCPACHAYRFQESTEAVNAQALKLAKKKEEII